MDLINISIEQDEILRHLATPIDDCISHSVSVSELPKLRWH